MRRVERLRCVGVSRWHRLGDRTREPVGQGSGDKEKLEGRLRAHHALLWLASLLLQPGFRLSIKQYLYRAALTVLDALLAAMHKLPSVLRWRLVA